jgi:hypothetical protein
MLAVNIIFFHNVSLNLPSCPLDATPAGTAKPKPDVHGDVLAVNSGALQNAPAGFHCFISSLGLNTSLLPMLRYFTPRLS